MRKQLRAARYSTASLRLVDSDNPPLRLFLGEAPLSMALADYGSRLTTWAQWQQVAAAAQGSLV